MTRPLVLFTAAALLVGAIMLAGGCSEKEVPYVIDNEIVTQYLANSPDARDLFRRDSLVLPDAFTVDGDPAEYKIITDSTSGYTEINLRVDTVRYAQYNNSFYRIRHIYPAPLGEVWGDGEVKVYDYYYCRILRIDGADTTITPRTLAVNRYGYFLKLGSDNEPYRGWRLWAFNGGGPPSGEMFVKAGNDTTFYGDLRGFSTFRYTVIKDNLTTGEDSTWVGESVQSYVRLDRLPAPDRGVPFYLNCSGVSMASYYRLATALTDQGMIQSSMDRVSNSLYVDTIQTATNSAYLWNLLFMQDVVRIQEPGSNPPVFSYSWKAWCVPYRTPQ